MPIKPTIYFQGLCEEAISFYQTAVQAELLYLHRYGGNVDSAHLKPGTQNKVLRAALRIFDTEIYLSDGHCAGQPSFQGVSLSLSVTTRAEAESVIQALSKGGRVQIPLRKSAWAGLFGALVDKYGLHWTIEAHEVDVMR